MINRIILNFIFDEQIRSSLVLSDAGKIRLNTENKAYPKIQLKKYVKYYPTDDDLFFETPFLNPNAVKKWLLMEPIGELPEGTSWFFKIKTTNAVGTVNTNYFHDGGNWVVAGANDWNTVNEINANFETFPIATVGNKKIGFVGKLKTTDKTVTPCIQEIKILGQFDIEFFDDLVYDSVIRLLNEQFRSTSVVGFETGGSSSSSISLASVLDNVGYNIFDVESVYNLTDDPMELNNLHGSYTKGALKQDGFTYEYGTENFSSPIPAAKLVKIKFKYVPEISVKVSQDYFEVPSYPHITISRITEVNRKGFMMRNTNSYNDVIVDKENFVAVQHFQASQKSYRFSFGVHTMPVDEFLLTGAIKRFFAQVKGVFSWGMGLEYDMMLVDELDTAKNATINDSSDTTTSQGSFDVLGVIFFDNQSIDVPVVKRMTLNSGLQ